jgi:hypothetical protein
MRFASGGEVVAVRGELPWVSRLIAGVTGGAATDSAAPTGSAPTEDAAPTVVVVVESSTAPFARDGLRPVTRGAYGDGQRTVLLDACGSGFDLSVVAGEELAVTARYRPRLPIRAANLLLSQRFRLLAGQVLVHYPVLWRAGWRGRVPLHASVIRDERGSPLLAGPGGVGKSRLLVGALAAGAQATSDNLCCADAEHCFGLAEPVRTDGTGARGTRTSHGRVELALAVRVGALAPDRVVVLERGPRTEIVAIKPDEAARALTAGTYAAGELRRYWAFAATLALSTGRGPAHPPIEAVAAGYTDRLPCVRARVGDGATLGTAQLYEEVLS